MKPLVSVIIPVFRVEDYLNRCVESVCRQTYKTLEIILVDDGSDDNCPQMCDDWTKKDNRIKVVHKQNGGLSDARNAGMRVMTGEFVYFLDSDDYIVDNAIERMVSVITEKMADAVSFGYTKIDDDGKELSASSFTARIYSFSYEKDKLEFIYKNLLQYKLGWEAWNRMYRTSIIKENNLWFEPNKEIFAEDRCFNLYYTLCSKNIVCMPEKLHYYLIRSTSIMGKQKEWHINEAIALSKKVCELAKKKDYRIIVDKFDYVMLCIVANLVFFMKPEEYGYYADKIQDKAYCLRPIKRIDGVLIFMNIWGRKSGLSKYKQYKKFTKYLKA